MRKLVLQMQISVDGFVSDADSRMNWIFDAFDAAVTTWIVEHLRNAGMHAMGSRTFADMKEHWPTSKDRVAEPMNAIPKVVFSRRGLGTAETTRPDGSWDDPRVASGDLADEIKRLKQEPGGEILAHGGAGFARSLVVGDLVDEYRLFVHPIALGRGLPLFSELRAPRRLELVSSERFSTGLIVNVLRPRGSAKIA